ncbi:MAG: glycosyltransferase WbuB [Chloroflexi bacterium]|nr:MAG: glycosyltransferase WbuB [Chloroflexota bacterium]
MRLLYVASGIAVPGAYGGATHTLEVAQGLAALGHELHVVAHHPRRQWRTLVQPTEAQLNAIHIHYIDVPKALSLLAYPPLVQLIRQLRPHALIERYYNLAGAGILAARQHGLPSLLEVNALIVDPPAVLKRRLDDRLGRPLQRWAIAQCQMAARIVTPLHTTVPQAIDRRKIMELPWGANVERFRRAARGADDGLRVKLGIPPDRPIAVFVGSFRAWHGVHDFVAAGVRLLEVGENLHLLLLGDGPERPAAEAAVGRWYHHFTFAGSIPHDQVPSYLALAAVGVAPFNTAPHPALRSAGFFWSPLKIYEYMAMSLPVVTAKLPPLDVIIRDGQEGALFQEGNVDNLAAAIRRVLHAADRAEMGERARQRVVEHYSWQRHCQALDTILNDMLREQQHG